jgi:hypothetical protein
MRVPADFARQLERELAEMTRCFDEVFAKWRALNDDLPKLNEESRRMAVFVDLLKLREPCVGYQVGLDSDLCVHCGRMWSDHQSRQTKGALDVRKA